MGAPFCVKGGLGEDDLSGARPFGPTSNGADLKSMTIPPDSPLKVSHRSVSLFGRGRKANSPTSLLSGIRLSLLESGWSITIYGRGVDCDALDIVA